MHITIQGSDYKLQDIPELVLLAIVCVSPSVPVARLLLISTLIEQKQGLPLFTNAQPHIVRNALLLQDITHQFH